MTNQNPTGTPTAKLSNGKFNTPYVFGNAELLQGIIDADNDALRVALVTAENGEINNNNDTFTFLPDKDFNGAVTLDYVISDDNGGELNTMKTFNISAANQIPTGNATAKLANGKVNMPYSLNAADLLTGFTDADNDTLRVSLITADNGEIVDNNNGSFTFSPDKDASGLITLNYIISDDNGGEISATQSFNLTADAISDSSSINHAPTGSATATLSNGKANTVYTIQNTDLLKGFTDADNDALRVSLVTAENGEIVDNNNGTFTFSPDKDASGLITLNYVISDDKGSEIAATQTFSIIGDAPIIVIPKNNTPHTGDISIVGDLIQNKTLTINNTLADADGLGTFSYQWLTNGESISSATQDAYTLTESDVGKTIKVKVSFIDGGNTLETATSKVTEVIQSATLSNGKTEQGDSGNNLIIGTGKNDQLSGLAGADTLRGNAGNDILNGGAGNDLLEGGNGDDVLTAGDGNDKLLGGSGNDNLMGNAGNDTLEGGAGKDTLNGGAGVDSMTGGDGDDYYVVDNSKDRVIESNKSVILGGKDTVKATSSYTLGENIENLILDDAEGKGFNGTGNKSDNVITGNIGDDTLNGMMGNDKLDAGEGDDTLDGGLGIDTLIGGNGSDVYYMNNLDDQIIEDKNSGDQDQIIAKVNFNLTQSENVEVLTLSGAKAKEGDGNELNNLLQEEANGNINNIFNGNGGDDVIYGQGGNDTLEGGEGNDELDGGDGKDTAVFTGSSEDYQITRNIDVEGVAQLIIEYKGNDETILEGKDILTNIEILQFAEGETINTNTFLVSLTGVTTNV
jgi:Ca2+-binding RTX toxin-like protein